jgi:hypothetical protein
MNEEETAVELATIKERMNQMDKTVETVCKKIDWFQTTLLVTLGGVIVNLCVLLAK